MSEVALPRASRASWLSYATSNRSTGAGIVLSVLLVVAALIAPWVVPHDPLEQSFVAANQGPSADYWFGTTRSVVTFSARVAGRTRVFVDRHSGAGACSGRWRLAWHAGWLFRRLDRPVDFALRRPAHVVPVAAAWRDDRGRPWPQLSQRGHRDRCRAVSTVCAIGTLVHAGPAPEPFIDASIVYRAVRCRSCCTTCCPNIAGPLVVALSLWIATAIRLEAALSFLGLGAQPPAPSWGNMIRDGMSGLVGDPWPAAFAGAAITLAVLSFNMVGDALRDMLDPRDGNMSALLEVRDLSVHLLHRARCGACGQ